MKSPLLSFRGGHATNSSSCHSIIFLPEDMKAEDEKIENFNFSSQRFIASSKSAKAAYVALLLYNSLSFAPPSIRKAVVKQWMGNTPKEIIDPEKVLDTGSLYSQSGRSLPMSFPNSLNDKEYLWPEEEFFQELKEFLLKDRIAILGRDDYGNSNDPLEQFKIKVPFDEDLTVICRKDTPTGVWTTYNRESGAKARFRFEDNLAPYTGKMSSPELSDIKVTGYCTYGCQFCLVPETLVKTPFGEKKIEDLLLEEIVLVDSSPDNKHKSTVEESTVKQKFERFYSGLIIDITLEDNSVLSLTPDHEVITTNRGWVKAAELDYQDDVKTLK